MGGKTGEWGEGPAGATVPYDVRGLHAARGANWTAPRGDIRSKLKKINPHRRGLGSKRVKLAQSASDALKRRTNVRAVYCGC